MNISGFSPQSLQAVEEMLYAEIDWQKQFKTGKGPGPKNSLNYEKDSGFGKSAPAWDTGSQKNNPKQNNDSEMLSPASYPKGPGNPQGGSSKEVFGLRALG